MKSLYEPMKDVPYSVKLNDEGEKIKKEFEKYLDEFVSDVLKEDINRMELQTLMCECVREVIIDVVVANIHGFVIDKVKQQHKGGMK